jgi:hypothetical protein
MLLGQDYVENPMAEERVQRRPGFRRMIEADEASTLATLKARRKDVLEPLLAKHDGRVLEGSLSESPFGRYLRC